MSPGCRRLKLNLHRNELASRKTVSTTAFHNGIVITRLSNITGQRAAAGIGYRETQRIGFPD
jgi:hypothetical protein